MEVLQGIEIEGAAGSRSQIYEATHNRAGQRLPYMYRSFISFSYGGKNIEDFGLIAVTNGDRLSHAVYADFNDNVTDSNVLDGQLYWSTHFKANAWDLTLATDGITERQLDEFKHWFAPGKVKELILAERPNRGIMARISKAPAYSMLPFEGDTTITINDTEYKTKTTLYKGEITINFVMDDPFWYSLNNILDLKINDIYTSQWIDANGQQVNVLSSPDALKILAEDGVLTSSLFDSSAPEILTGDGELLTVDLSMNSYGSRVNGAQVDEGHIAYIISGSGHGINVGDENNPGYFYYGGTAPCAPILSFTLIPQLGQDGYIISPNNDIGNTNNESCYNTLTIESLDKKEFKFTTPSIYTGFNQVVKIFKTAGDGVAWEDVRAQLRDNVKHYAPRQYGLAVLESMRSGVSTTTTILNNMIAKMSDFIKDTNGQIVPAAFTINSKNGQAVAYIKYRNTNLDSPAMIESEENVGDMILSNYLLIEERNYPNAIGQIQIWSEEHPEYSHKVYCDIAGGLQNFDIQYKFLYL